MNPLIASHQMYTTPATLLERLRQPADHQAWSRFVKLYAPLLHKWARQTGFGIGDADDLVQEIFTHLVCAMPRFVYDPAQSFRSWLKTVASRKWLEMRRRKRIDAHGVDHMEVEDENNLDPAELLETEEFTHLVIRRALDVVHADFPLKYEIFKRVMIQGESRADVARELGMSAEAARVACFRIVTRLKQDLAGMVD